jgi:DNA polymerase-3 subunit alpha
MYVPLHVHTEYSTLDGIVKVPDYVNKVKEYGLEACAVTDHGNLGSVVKFYTECRKNNIKPIIGLEAYIVDDVNVKERDMAHIVLLAKDKEGYLNLLKLNNLSFQYFYYKPRLDYKILKEYSSGLVCMSACMAGHIPSALLQGEHDRARYYINLLLEIFKDDFYLEIQDNNLEDQFLVNSLLASLGKEKGVPLVATSDIHYLNPEEQEAHLAILAIQTKKTLQQILDGKDFSGFVNSADFCLKPYEVFKNNLQQYPEAIAATTVIADKCNLIIDELENPKPLFPVIQLPNNITPEEYLTRLVKSSLLQLDLPINEYQKYFDRLQYELEVINKQGFAPYFLVLKDIIDFCRREGIRVGHGRGSASGSLVSYLLGITRVDPIRHGLLFERSVGCAR